MANVEKKGLKKAEADPAATRGGLPRGFGVLVVSLIAVSVLPVYSSARRTLPPIGSARLTPQSEAFKVAPALDSGNAVSQIVPAGGGSVTAIGADGTKFTLFVPVNALLSSARVTVTPVSALGGLPISGGLAAAVQIEPDGLRLFEFATLVIEPPQSLSPNQETSFAWDEAGDDFHLFPLPTPGSTRRENARGSEPQLNPRGLNFKLLHFGGYGVGSGTEADRAAQEQRPPNGLEARFEQSMEAINGRERRRQLAATQTTSAVLFGTSADDDDDPDYVDEIAKLLKNHYTNEVKPAMDAALQSRDDNQLLCAIQKALGCNRQIELLLGENLTGKTGKFLKKAQKAISKFLEKALSIQAENSARRCSKDHQPQESIILLSIGRQQQLLMFDSSKTYASAKSCAHFELEFDSATELRDPAATVTTRVHATVPLHITFDGPIAETTGEAPLEYPGFKWTPADPDCSVTATTHGSVFRLLSFNIDLNIKSIGYCDKPAAFGTVNLVSVDMDPGLPTESITATCPPPSGTVTFTQVIWSGTFGEFHSDEDAGGAGFLTISGWEPGEGSLLARKTYNRNGSFDGQYPMTERTTINIWHRPD